MMSTSTFEQIGRGPSFRRLMIVGGALIVGAAALALLGHAYGEIALLAIFAALAALGVLALFALALGFLEFRGRGRSDEALRRFLDELESGAAIADGRGRIIYANPSYASILGAGGGEGVVSPERAFAGEPEAAEAIYQLVQIAREGRGGHREFRLSRALAERHEPGGAASAHWYRVSVRALANESRRLQAWQIADVTEERRVQERSFRELQDAIDYLDHAPAGFVAADDSFAMAYVNATLAEWLGIDLAAFKPYEIRLLDFVPEEFRSTFEQGANEGGAVDLELETRDGRRIPVRILSRPAHTAVAGPGTRRMLVLNRLAHADTPQSGEIAEARFTRFFNSSPMAIAALDEKGRVHRSNAAFARLFPDAGVHGAFDAELAESAREGFLDALASARAGRSPTAPLDTEARSGRVVRLYISGVPSAGESSEEAAIVYGVDITEQRALEEQFAKSQKMQAVGNLAGGIAHDFNNVLTVITGSVDFLLLNHRTGDPSFQDLILIKQNTNRAASLVRQLLAYSRRQTMRPKVLNLTDVIADMHLLLKRIGGDTVRLERDHGRDLWPVMADIGQFEQVVTNLVQNARDAMPGGGTVTIATRNVPASEARSFGHAALPEADYVLVEVADTGTGMARDVAERIFEPFFTTKDIGKGTGLGLSMAYGIIEQTGGHIFVDTELGKGTKFRIFLPRHIPGESEATVVGDQPRPAPGKVDLSGTATILLVEDEDNVRSVNTRSLSIRGYQVLAAASGLEALELLEEHGDKIDLVVSDVVMPEMDGPTLLKEMRTTYPDLKFIFVSGYAEEAFSKNLPEGEKFGFLAKPFSLNDLAVAVKKALEESS